MRPILAAGFSIMLAFIIFGSARSCEPLPEYSNGVEVLKGGVER